MQMGQVQGSSVNVVIFFGPVGKRRVLFRAAIMAAVESKISIPR